MAFARRTSVLLAGIATLVAGCAADQALPDPRQADDCVEFTKDAVEDAGRDPGHVLPPGTAPAVGEIKPYWFGPSFGKRHAILAGQFREDLSNTDEAQLFWTYTTFYQVPEDGCQSGMLPGYDPAPEYWGPGSEIEVQSQPAYAPLVQRTTREVFGGLAGKESFELEDGSVAVLLGGDETYAAIVVGRTFVLVGGASVNVVRARIRELTAVRD